MQQQLWAETCLIRSIVMGGDRTARTLVGLWRRC
jgi:hypothetical protein